MQFQQLLLFLQRSNEYFERWIYVLKHMEALNKLPWATKSPIFKKVSEISDISALSREEHENMTMLLKVVLVMFFASCFWLQSYTVLILY